MPTRSMTRSTTLRAALAAFAFVTLALLSALPASATDPINQTTFGGVAIDGYDPVAYFTDGKPVEGDKAYSYEWMGATWRFASQEHKDLFSADPDKYAPQYGGYCAYAVSQGKTAGIDPDAWKIVDGKLYLNYNKKIQKTWESDQASYIKAANKNWPEIVGH